VFDSVWTIPFAAFLVSARASQIELCVWQKGCELEGSVEYTLHQPLQESLLEALRVLGDTGRLLTCLRGLLGQLRCALGHSGDSSAFWIDSEVCQVLFRFRRGCSWSTPNRTYARKSHREAEASKESTYTNNVYVICGTMDRDERVIDEVLVCRNCYREEFFDCFRVCCEETAQICKGRLNLNICRRLWEVSFYEDVRAFFHIQLQWIY